jgi:hypothetical protein
MPPTSTKCASSYDLRRDCVSYDVVLKVLHRGETVQVFMRPKVIIGEEGFLEFGSHALNRIFEEICSSVELFSEGTIGSFDAPIILGFSGRKDEEGYFEICTSLFKLGPKLGPSIDLKGTNGKGGLLDEFLE